MDLKKIENDVKEYLSSKNYKLFSMNYHKKDETLEILLDNKMDMDELEAISNDVSKFLDQYENEFDCNYILDLSTVGVEKPIRNLQEANEAISSYVYVKTKDGEYNGTLLSVQDDVMELEVKDKTRNKKVLINYKDAKKMRYAVKF